MGDRSCFWLQENLRDTLLGLDKLTPRVSDRLFGHQLECDLAGTCLGRGRRYRVIGEGEKENKSIAGGTGAFLNPLREVRAVGIDPEKFWLNLLKR